MSNMSEKFELEKTIQALNFLLSQEPSQTMSKMKLLKLLWLVDRYTIRNYGYSLTGDSYFAMKLGSVGSTTKDILDSKKRDEYIEKYIKVLSNINIRSSAPIDFNEFSETDLSALRTVWSVYGDMDPNELSEYSHKFPEWLRYEKRIQETGGSYPEKIEDFFANPPVRPHKYIFNEDPETLHTSKDVLKQQSKLRSIFV